MSDVSHIPDLTKISTGTIIRFFLVGVLVLSLYYLFSVVLAVIAAVILASAIEPLVRRLKRYRLHRIVAVVLVYLGIMMVLVTVLVFFLPAAVNDTVALIRELPQTISLEAIWTPVQSFGFNVGPDLNGSESISLGELLSRLQNLFVGTTGAVQAASMVFGGILSFILILILSFYLAVQEDGVDDFLRIVTPVKHYNYIIDLWKRSQRKIGYWLQGQILLSIIVGVLVYLTLTVVGVPNALFLAILAAGLEIIPVFGPVISAVPAVLLAFADGGISKGLLVVALYAVIQQFENQLFYPLVVKKIVGISPIVVILALIIGAKLAGILGAIIAVPLSAALMEYISDVKKGKKAELAESEPFPVH